MSTLYSTFPLDQAAIRRRVVSALLGDPVTWLPLLPGVAACTIFDLPAIVGIGLCVVGALFVANNWRARWAGLRTQFQIEVIARHNALQNETLAAAQRELTVLGCSQYAAALEEFLEMKKKLEARIHASGLPSAEGVQLEQLVDGLCFEARDRLLELGRQRATTKQGSDDEKQVLAKVDAARQVLANTVAHAESLLGDSDSTAPDGRSSLETITQRLREETEMACRVQERLRQANAALDPDLAPFQPPPSSVQARE